MKKNPYHSEQLVALRRIEGQIKGLQRMIDEKRYCIDIMTQINSAVGALLRVQDSILEKHLDMCVTDALKGKSDSEKNIKINEIIAMIKKFRKSF